MAKKKSKDSGKGVAFLKRAKIDKAQSTMLAAVCGASLLVGVTLVGVYYLGSVIAYNGKLIAAKTEAAGSYKSVQENLNNVYSAVMDLSTNEYLYSVTYNTQSRNCDNVTTDMIKEYTERDELKQSELEILRNCSSLRIIPDTIPAVNNITSTLGGLNQLLIWAGGDIEGIGADSNSTDVVFGDEAGATFHTLGAGITIEGHPTAVNNSIKMIESSIRNYDINTVYIEWNEEKNDDGVVTKESIDFNASYNPYYSDSVDVRTYKKTVCADAKNEKCPGDGDIEEDYVGGGDE